MRDGSIFAFDGFLIVVAVAGFVTSFFCPELAHAFTTIASSLQLR